SVRLDCGAGIAGRRLGSRHLAIQSVGPVVSNSLQQRIQRMDCPDGLTLSTNDASLPFRPMTRLIAISRLQTAPFASTAASVRLPGPDPPPPAPTRQTPRHRRQTALLSVVVSFTQEHGGELGPVLDR